MHLVNFKNVNNFCVYHCFAKKGVLKGTFLHFHTKNKKSPKLNAENLCSQIFSILNLILPQICLNAYSYFSEDVNAVVRGTVSTNIKEGLKYLHVDALNVDILVKNVRMGVKNIFKNNRILSECRSLFW